MSTKAIAKERKEIERREREIRSQCSHTNHKGDFVLDFFGNGSDARCKICGEEFNMDPINNQELKNAINVVHNAIQQCRSFSDACEDVNIVTMLGRADYNVTALLPALYRNVSKEFYKGSNNKKNKNKKKQHDSFGGYSNGRFSSL